MRGHRKPSLELQCMSGLAHIFILLSHLQTQAVFLRKGRLKLPGRKAGPMSTALSWALGSFHRETVRYPKGPRCQMACDMVAMACSSVPGRCVIGGCLGPGFYCWWTSLSNLESRMMALSETGPVVSTLLRWKNKTCKLHWLCNVGILPVLAFTGKKPLSLSRRDKDTRKQ